MTTAILEVLARLVPFAIGWFLIGSICAWRTRHERAALRSSTGSPYRAPFSDAGLAPTADPGEAWQAGVATERARVLALARVARGACGDDGERRVCDAIVEGIEGGAK